MRTVFDGEDTPLYGIAMRQKGDVWPSNAGCPVVQDAGFAVQRRNAIPRFEMADIAGEAALASVFLTAKF
ncbi:hypothetical protein I5535_17070 [Rhodobacteraceae bacterium F11138]|nr:hypothetical protein [Rhodobacteraceae bacterium F11138]